MSPPYTTVPSPSVGSNHFKDAPMGPFAQLYSIVRFYWKAAWALSKLIYPFLIICLACYQVYERYAISSATINLTKATEKLTERYSEYKPAQESLSELCRDLTDVIDSSTSANEATLEAIQRAVSSGTSVPPPEVAELLRKLGKTQEAARERTARVGRAVCRVTMSLYEGTARAYEEYRAANDRLVEVRPGCIRCRRESCEEKCEEL